MKVFPKVFLYVFILLLIYSISSAAVVSVYSESIIKEQVYNHLTTAVDSRAHNIETVLNKYSTIVASLCTRTDFINSFNESIEYSVRHSDSYSGANLTKRIVPNLLKLRIVDYNGSLFINTYVGPSEKPVNITMLRKYAVNSTYTGSIHRCTEDVNLTALSVAHALKIQNITRGFLIVSFDTKELYEILTEQLGMGETGETYIVNRDGYLLSPSRFIDNAILNTRVNTETIHHWEEHISQLNRTYGNHTDFEPYNVTLYAGYQGMKVLGTHLHIISNDIIIIAEIESHEAFEPVTNMLLYIVVTSLIILIIGSVAAFFTMRRLTQPILGIHEGMKEIERGNYDFAINAHSDDELEELATSLSHMAQKVKESKKDLEEYNRELETKVAERTEDMNRRMKDSERFRIATLNMLEDISETKKELEQSGKLYSSVVNTSIDGIIIVQDFRLKFVNSAFLNMMGYTEEEALKLELRDIFNPEVHTYLQDIYQGDARGLPELFETLFLSKTGENIPLEVRTAQMTYAGKDAVLYFTRDLRKTITLETNIAETLTKLQKSEKRREEFIDMAAHELRTPLTAIKTYSEMMQEGQMGVFTDEEREHLETLGTSISKLNDQITGLLDSSKIIAGKMKGEKILVDMKALTEETVKELNPLFSRKKQAVNMEVKDIQPILASPNLMSKVMINLIGNAIKFTEENGRIDIRLYSRDDELNVEVEDNGIGISEKDLPQLFERFFIGDRKLTSEQPQLGLGLSIVKVIVEQHNGRIWVESELGKGSIFHFTIPMQPMKIPSGA